MAKFTVRVELHGKDHDDDVYTELHDAMEGHKFLRWATNSETGQQVWLPHAEYFGQSSNTSIELAKEVRGWALAETSHEDTVGVLVTQWGNVGWSGLKLKT